MANNKFIERLKGKSTAGSLVEIKNTRAKTSFADMPVGSSNAVDVFSDHRDNATIVANGTLLWKVDGETLESVESVFGDGKDFLSVRSVAGSGLWLNASYTFPSTGDPNHPVAMVFNPNTKWVLKLCGDSLIVDGGNVLDFTLIVKIGSAHIFSKNFKVVEHAGQFSTELILDFDETNTGIVKAGGLAKLTLQLLCGTDNASARIYNGMTVLTCLQRKVDASAVSSKNINVQDVLDGAIIPDDYFSNPEFIDQIEDGKDAYAVFNRDGDSVNLAGWTPKDKFIVKSDVMPTPTSALAGYVFQYVGETNNTYHHGYIYECQRAQMNMMTFTPDIMSCSWADLSVFLATQSADYNSVTNGTMTYFASADLWRLDAKDAQGNTVVAYQQYTSDWENVGFTFTGTPQDEQVVSFTRATADSYDWVRIDVQPNTAFWGGITGNLQDQTDLQNALDAKQDNLTATGGLTLENNIISGQTLQNLINAINALIPAQATAQNQLADKAFVNSSIATNTANFIGTFNSVAEMEAYSGPLTNNDYAFVVSTDAAGNTVYVRYKYTTATTPASWKYEYELNNSSFTASQWATINSGGTAEDVAKARTALQPSDLTSRRINGAPLSNVSSVYFGTSSTAAATAEKVVSIPSIQTLDAGVAIIVLPTVTSTVANSTIKLNDFSAYPMRYGNAAITTSTDAYVWTANTPSIFVFDGSYWRFVAQGYRQVYSTMSVAEGRAGTATTGRVLRADYLKQIIQGTTLTGIDTTTTGAVTDADTITGGIGKLQATKADLADIGNGTVVIKQGGVEKGRFSVNQGSNAEINIDAGSGVNIDNLTITNNGDGDIQAVATINANTATGATNPIYDWVGTLAEYNAQNIETLHPDWVCFITDDIGGSATVIAELAEGLNNKADLSTVAHVVTEFQEPTSANNQTWYRKYADGWVEQGILFHNRANSSTWTFPIPMTEGGYDSQITNVSGDGPRFAFVRGRYATYLTYNAADDSSENNDGTYTIRVCGMAA